jgi:hypothetical protein
VLQYCAHVRILRWQPSGRKNHLSTHNAISLELRYTEA